MTVSLREAAAAIGARGEAPDVMVAGWSVDTRTLAEGDVFFALRGPNHDGHDFVAQAFEKGAAAAVVERQVEAAGPLLTVSNTLRSLQSLAAWVRRRWPGTVVAVTGSAGKTTTKDVIAALLAARRRTGKTVGNYNNHVGLPLSILRLPDDAEVAVLQIGMNHAGEIAHLASIARPEIGVVTNVGYAHIENFDSIDGVAAAKRELIEALPPDGTAVLNADDERVARFAEGHSGRVVTFGFSEGAEVRAVNFRAEADGTHFEVPGEGEFRTALFGRHGVSNILAGFAVASVFGIRPRELREAVAALEPAPMRGRRFEHNGITIIDDCYNANPDAVRAMLETLRDMPARRRIAVLGEMLELGRWTEALHQEIGRVVAACRVDVLVGIRGAARQLADAAVDAGLAAGAAYFFSDPEPAGDALVELARPGDVILFKGSRAVHVERALQRFLSRTGSRDGSAEDESAGGPGAAVRAAAREEEAS